MHEKDGVKARLARFSEDKGFYIVLMLCVLAIGISGYVLFFLPEASEPSEYDIGLGESLPSAADLPAEDLPKIPDVNVQLAPEEPEEPAEAARVSAPEPAVSAPAAQEELTETWIYHRDPVYCYPVSGEVIRTYSVDALQYDETMGDWRTHNGIDIACGMGDPVLAVADGRVEEIYEDPLEGTVLVIEHEEGVTSRLCGLAPDLPVAVGDSVKAGDVVAAAGNTMKTESLMECHVHLVMKQDGQYIDPLSLKFE